MKVHSTLTIVAVLGADCLQFIEEALNSPFLQILGKEMEWVTCLRGTMDEKPLSRSRFPRRLDTWGILEQHFNNNSSSNHIRSMVNFNVQISGATLVATSLSCLRCTPNS